MTTQHAAVITEFGDSDVLTFQQDVPMPTLEDNQVLVKVAYAGINPVDYKTRQGLGWGAQKIKETQFANGLPAILGFDLSGEIVDDAPTAAASNQAALKKGDKVAALSFSGGAYAQYVAVPVDLLTPVPDGVDLKTAGSLPTVAVTAKQLMDFAEIGSDDHVVMSAPAGGVGHLLLQLLMNRGIKLTVICSPEKYDKLSQLVDVSQLAGWIDYTKSDDFPELDADVLLDLVGGDAGVRALTVVKNGGKVVCLPTIWVDKLKEAGTAKDLNVQGFIAKPNADTLAYMLNEVAAGRIKSIIQAQFPLAQAAAAHAQLEQGDSFGKIVLAVV